VRVRRLLVFVLVLAGGARAPAAAQGFAESQDIETSVRASGMGGATTAVTWGEPGAWGNPAALAGTRGIAWLEGNTRLPSTLLGDSRFESRRVLAGGAGVGLSIMGEPVRDLGRSRVDHGREEGTDPFGNPTGVWDLGERIEGWGLGVSPLELVNAYRAAFRGDEAPLLPRLDVGLGYQHKRTRVVLAPGVVAEAENHDWGLNARFAVLPGDPEAGRARVELSAGFAELNADETSEFDFGGATGHAGPSTRMRRLGFAARAVLPFGAPSPGEGSPWTWWPAAVPSAIVLGVAYDHEQRTAGGSAPGEDADHWGCEASFMEILTGRAGYVSDLSGDITDFTFGVGLRAPIGPWASLGYDWARVPQAAGLERLDRHGWSAWIHPLAIWRSTQGR
jgi:hypothetical protein